MAVSACTCRLSGIRFAAPIDRALNFAATNAFQAAHTFAQAVADGMELDTIEVEKSPFGRQDSDCWDVKLKFLDPENNRRAKKLFRFTIDGPGRLRALDLHVFRRGRHLEEG